MTDIEQERKTSRLIALLFCDYANTTDEGKINLLGIFDRIYVEAGIKKTRKFFVFVKLAETYDSLEVQIISPAGKLLGAALLEPKINPGKEDEINFAQALIGIELETQEQGIYWFNIIDKTKPLGGSGLKVVFKKREERHGDSIYENDPEG